MGKKQTQAMRRYMLVAIFLVLAAVGLFGLLPNITTFDNAYDVLGRANRGWLVCAILATLASYVAAGAMYSLLSTRRLNFWATVLVQVAGGFVNRVLPAGIGAVSVSYRYLRVAKHPPASAAAIVTMNNVLGLVGNVVLVVLLLIIQPIDTLRLQLPKMPPLAILLLMGATVCGVVVAIYIRRRMLLRIAMSYIRQLAIYRTHRFRLFAACAVSIVLTACFAFVTFAAARAVGLHITYLAALFVMSIGVLGGVLLPSPGGLGAVEGGMIAAFIAVGFPSSEALAATLIYRLCTFWFALLAGAIALLAARRLTLL